MFFLIWVFSGLREFILLSMISSAFRYSSVAELCAFFGTHVMRLRSSKFMWRCSSSIIWYAVWMSLFDDWINTFNLLNRLSARVLVS